MYYYSILIYPLFGCTTVEQVNSIIIIIITIKTAKAFYLLYLRLMQHQTATDCCICFAPS